MGTVDYKSIVEQMMLGWMPCYAPTYSIYKNPTPTAIEDIYGAKAYLASDGVPLDVAVRDIDDASTSFFGQLEDTDRVRRPALLRLLRAGRRTLAAPF